MLQRPELERLLVVMAHPDDVDFGSAGSVAKWVSEGWTVYYVLVQRIRDDGADATSLLAAVFLMSFVFAAPLTLALDPAVGKIAIAQAMDPRAFSRNAFFRLDQQFKAFTRHDLVTDDTDSPDRNDLILFDVQSRCLAIQRNIFIQFLTSSVERAMGELS